MEWLPHKYRATSLILWCQRKFVKTKLNTNIPWSSTRTRCIQVMGFGKDSRIQRLQPCMELEHTPNPTRCKALQGSDLCFLGSEEAGFWRRFVAIQELLKQFKDKWNKILLFFYKVTRFWIPSGFWWQIVLINWIAAGSGFHSQRRARLAMHGIVKRNPWICPERDKEPARNVPASWATT